MKVRVGGGCGLGESEHWGRAKFGGRVRSVSEDVSESVRAVVKDM